MKVELSIKDDRELKNHIKDAIKGEVKSIARGEIRTIIADVFKEKFDGNMKASAEQMLKDEIRSLVKDELKGSSNGWGNSTTSFIKKVAREYVEEHIQKAFTGYEGVVK